MLDARCFELECPRPSHGHGHGAHGLGQPRVALLVQEVVELGVGLVRVKALIKWRRARDLERETQAADEGGDVVWRGEVPVCGRGSGSVLWHDE